MANFNFRHWAIIIVAAVAALAVGADSYFKSNSSLSLASVIPAIVLVVTTYVGIITRDPKTISEAMQDAADAAKSLEEKNK
jgi:hypothetical protein